MSGARAFRHLLALLVLAWVGVAAAQTAVASLGLSAEEQSWLASRRDRVIRVAVTELPPLVLRDPKAGEYRGIAIDYLRLTEARLGVRVRVDYYASLAEMLDAGRAGRADVLLTTARTPEREAFLRFPAPYVTLRNAIITRQGAAGAGHLTLAELAGRSIAVLEESAAHAHLRRDFPDLVLQPHRDERAVILAVAFGEADAAVVDLARTAWQIAKEGLTNLVVAGETPIEYPLSMAVRMDLPQLAGILDKVSASFTPAEHDAIDGRWIHLAEPGLLQDRRLWVALAVMIAGVLTVGAWNLTLRRQVAERTRALLRQVGELERLETELREQAELHRDLAELASDWFWEQDRELRFTRLWGGGWARANFDLARSVGKRRWELDVRGVSAEEWAAHKAVLDAHEVFRNFVLEIRDGIGQWHWVSVSGQPVFDDDGEFKGYRGSASDISQRLRDHHAIEDAMARQRALLDGSSAMLGLLNAEGRLVEVNQRALDFVAAERGEAISRPLWESTWWGPPGDSARLRDDVTAAASGQPVRHLVQREDAQGKAHWLDYSLHCIFDADGRVRYLVPEGRDVTDAKRAELALDSLIRTTGAVFGEAFFNRLVTELGEALKVRYVLIGRLVPERAQIRTLALWVDGRIGDNLTYDLVGTPCANVVAREVCTYPTGVQGLFPEDLMLQDLSIESYMGVPLAGVGGEPIGLLVVMHDRPLVDSENGRRLMELFAIRAATEMERAEEAAKVLELNATLEARVVERTERLAQANRELEAFSYSVSHDLRAPLRHIGGFVELLRDEVAGGLTAEGQRYIDVVASSTQRMERLIEDLLTFSRLGRAPVARQRVAVAPLVREVIDQLAPDIGTRAIEWQIGPLPTVSADPQLLRQVFMNLIENAIKYSGPRQPAVIAIGVDADTAATESGVPAIFVRDNGVGFDPAYGGKMFGVFQRLHADHEFPGTGIGLANVKRIVERHGGRVWAEGRVDGGACFHFTLPDGDHRDKEPA